MFKLNRAKTRLVTDGAQEIKFQQDPNFRTGLKKRGRKLVIHGVKASSMQNAVDFYLGSARSLHLLIEKNGQEIVQMVDLDCQAMHAPEYDQDSLGIGLIYPGQLTESRGFFYSKDRFNPLEILFAPPPNDQKKRWYPFYPQEQLSALLEITRLFDQAFGIEQVLLYPEIHTQDLETGPAIPLNRFRQLVEGEGVEPELLEETASAVDLFLQPGGVGPKFLERRVPARTPIAVTYDDGEWVLVEVMADLKSRQWTIGWMRADQVAAKRFKPVVNDQHRLVTETNHRIKFIPAHEKNFNPDSTLDPRFVVIHFTTGTDPKSIVHTFQNPDEGVCTHLLVARNGHVIQFVPFDKVAFHCGLSAWESVRHLNQFAIGIEVDNAGYLDQTRKGFKRKGKTIPQEQVEFKKHWKEDHKNRPWQTFSEDQVRVVSDLVKALIKKYPTIKEIVGHDMVNLVNRLDPGPFYPLGELREAILGSPQPVIQHYQTLPAECPIFVNIGGRPPFAVPHPDHGELAKNSKVRVRNEHVYEHWSLVIVKQTSSRGLRDKEGWVLSDSIESDEETSKTKFAQTFYKVIPAVVPRLPPLALETGPLPQGTHVRIQYEDGAWALVAPVLEVRKDAEGHFEVVVPKEKVKKNFLEGWVQRENLQEL
jgi:N-acetyl-anhydromuramyl-L-alanine amidase AmpD